MIYHRYYIINDYTCSSTVYSSHLLYSVYILYILYHIVLTRILPRLKLLIKFHVILMISYSQIPNEVLAFCDL